MLPHLRLPQSRLITDINRALLSKTEIRHSALDEDLANQDALGIPDFYPVATTGIHVPLHVAFDPVRPSSIRKRKETLVCQEGPGNDVESVDVAWACPVDGDVFAAVDGAGVCDVEDVQVGRKAETVGPYETVGHGADVFCLWLESVDLTGEAGLRPDALMVPVCWVREPDRAVVGMDDDIVDRVELPPIEGRDECGALVGRLGIRDVDEAAGIRLAALGAVEEAVLVVDAAVPHAICVVTGHGALNADFSLIAAIVDAGDIDSFMGC